MKTGCVLLAAGAATRFGGGNKLLSDFLGLPVYVRALNAVPSDCFCAVAVVSGERAILEAAEERGFIPVLNDRPQDGASRSVKLGMQALPDTDALLFMVADQPCLSANTVRALLGFASESHELIVRPRCGEQAGSPVLFPRAFYPELLSLTGDSGGGKVCRAHSNALKYFDIEDPCELFDVDSRAALAELLSSCDKKN